MPRGLAVRRDLRPWFLAATLMLLSCDRSPTAPDPARLQLTLTLSSRSGQTGEVIVATARVANVGLASVNYSEPCLRQGVDIVMRDPGEAKVFTPCEECPGQACPACPDLLARLDPGQSLTVSSSFDGRLYHCAEPFAGPSGTYSVTASFTGWDQSGRHPVSVSRQSSFDWVAREPMAAAGPASR